MNDFEKRLLEWAYSKGPCGGYRQPNMKDILKRFHDHERRIQELKTEATIELSYKDNGS